MKLKDLLYLLLILLIGVIYYFLFSDYPKENNFVILGGDIVTMEPGQPTADAVYVKDGLVEAIGTKEEIAAFTNDKTKVLNLEGKTLLPGFIDIHSHPLLSAFLYNMVDLSGFTYKTPEKVWQALSNSVNQSSKGEWIICKGLDPILTPGLISPHISFLDSIAPDNPILILSQSLHSFWANTQAFDAIGINEETPDPSESSYYEKDKNGQLTGFFAEQEALTPFQNKITELYGVEQLMESTVAVLKDYARNGNTTVASLGLTTSDKNSLLLFEHLGAQKTKALYNFLHLLGKLPQREPLVRHFVYLRHDAQNLLPDSPQNGDDGYKILGIKYWYDGSPYTGSMYLKEPYMSTQLSLEGFRIPEGHHGEALMTKKHLEAEIKAHQEKGWQIAIHSQGDQAIEEIMNIFSSLNKTSPVNEYRHRLEHCLLLPSSTMEQMKELNVSPSFHINHLYYYGNALRDSIIGEERAANMLPVAEFRNSDLPFTLHADQPMYESDPISLLTTAVNRQTKEGDTIGIHQAISILEGLKALTIHAAWQLGMEDKIGSIKAGKYADFVILDQNPLKIASQDLRQLKIVKTIKDGFLIFGDSKMDKLK